MAGLLALDLRMTQAMTTEQAVGARDRSVITQGNCCKEDDEGVALEHLATSCDHPRRRPGSGQRAMQILSLQQTSVVGTSWETLFALSSVDGARPALQGLGREHPRADRAGGVRMEIPCKVGLMALVDDKRWQCVPFLLGRTP